MKIEGSRSAAGVYECEGREGMKRGERKGGNGKGKTVIFTTAKNRGIRYNVPGFKGRLLDTVKNMKKWFWLATFVNVTLEI